MMENDLLEYGRAVLASQPFSVLLGTQLLTFTAGRAELAIELKPEFLQQHGLAHGGLLSYLADNALAFVGGSVLGADVLTSEFKINYLRPARGHRVVARAHVISASTRQAICQCELFAMHDKGENLVAIALGTIIKRGS